MSLGSIEASDSEARDSERASERISKGKETNAHFVLTKNLAYTAPGNSTSNPGVTAAFTKMTCTSGNGCLRVGRDGGAAAADLRLSELSGEYPDRGLIGILLNVQIFWSCWTRIAVKCCEGLVTCLFSFFQIFRSGLFGCMCRKFN